MALIKTAIELEDRISKPLADVTKSLEVTARSINNIGTTGPDAGGLNQYFISLKNGTSTVNQHALALRGMGDSGHFLSGALRILRPALGEMGANLGGISTTARILSSFGLPGLAVAIGTTVAVAVQKANEELSKLKDRLDSIMQHPGASQKLLPGAEQEASNLETRLKNILSIQEQAARLQRDQPLVVGFGAAGGEAAIAGTEAYRKALVALYGVMRTEGVSVEDSRKAVDEFAAQMDKTGTVTNEMARKIGDVAPEALNILAKAFGYPITKDFLDSLKQTPEAAQQFAIRMNQILGEIKFDPKVTDFWDQWEKSSRQIGETTAAKIISSFSDSISGNLRDNSKQTWTEIWQDAKDSADVFLVWIGQRLDTIFGTELKGKSSEYRQIVKDISSPNADYGKAALEELSAWWEKVSEKTKDATYSIRDAASSVDNLTNSIGNLQSMISAFQALGGIGANPYWAGQSFEPPSSGAYGLPGGWAGYAGGGLFRGRGGIDTNLALLTHGEYIVPRRAVEHYGIQLLEWIRTLQFPIRGFAEGGLNLDRAVNIASPSISAMQSSRSLTLVLDTKRFNISGSKSTIDALEREATLRGISAAGIAPGWVR